MICECCAEEIVCYPCLFCGFDDNDFLGVGL